MQRRSLLRGGAAASLLIATRVQAGDDADGLEAPAFLDELEALSTPALRSQVNSKGYQVNFARIPDAWDLISQSALVTQAKADRALYNKLSERDLPRWPALRNSPDYAHLSNYVPKRAEFDLTSDCLDFIVTRNRFKLNPEPAKSGDVVVFSLRGCQLAPGILQGAWSKSHRLIAATPNHRETRCVMALWRRSDGAISVYRGSSVPVGEEMFSALRFEGLGASLLPTGLYRYRVGTHNASKPLARQQPGALLNQDRYVVLRTARDLVYDPYAKTACWTLGAAHNIHASGSSYNLERFNSAGCQVICGYYRTENGARLATGDWAKFQAEAKLFSAPSDRMYQLIVLTGHELALSAMQRAEIASSYYRLRPGSSGPEVEALQRKLGLPNSIVDGYFGADTTFAVLERCKASKGEYSSHIWEG